jgi:DNA (cytosine-5)-methyltransferase 1
MPKKLQFIDLFAGIGGTRIAFQKAGAECVFSSEWDLHCQKTYEANFGVRPHGDITKIREKDIPKFDVLVGGFPCQPFSSIGKREGFKHQTQGTLFYDIARILNFHKPKAFLLENVAGLLTHDDGKTFQVVLATLSDLGYQIEYKVLNAKDFGVPQKRERIYIIGFNKNKVRNVDFIFPKPKIKMPDIGKFVEKNVDDRSISKHLQKTYIYKVNDGRPEVINSKTKGSVKTLVASYHKIQRLTGTFVADGPTGLRLLTENECKAIMGFPKNFKIPVSRTQMYRQFGNSVAVPVVTYLAKAMLKHLEQNTRTR